MAEPAPDPRELCTNRPRGARHCPRTVRVVNCRDPRARRGFWFGPAEGIPRPGSLLPTEIVPVSFAVSRVCVPAWTDRDKASCIVSNNHRTGCVLVCAVSYTFLASAGEAGKRWARTYGGSGGDTFYSVQQTADGGYILAGTNNCFGYSGYDGWCLKVDASGNRVWENIYGGTSDDFLYGARVTADGGCILAGYTTSFGNGGWDAWCLKLDASGHTVWEKTYGAAMDEAAFAVDVTPDGGYVLAGTAGSFGLGDLDAWCLWLNASGAPVWQRTYGGLSNDTFTSVRATGDGACVVAGYTSSFGAGSLDAWCTKLDASGNVIWQKTYGGATPDVFSALQLAAGDAYVVAGYTTSFGSGMYVGCCLRLDASGNVVWQRAFGDGPLDYFLGVEATGDGGCVLAGSSYISGAANQEAWCLRLDASGNVIWQKTYGGSLNEYWSTVSTTADGGYILAGEAASFGAGDVRLRSRLEDCHHLHHSAALAERGIRFVHLLNHGRPDRGAGHQGPAMALAARVACLGPSGFPGTAASMVAREHRSRLATWSPGPTASDRGDS